MHTNTNEHIINAEVEAETIQSSFPGDDRPVNGMLKIARDALAKQHLRVADAAEWIGIPTSVMHDKLNGAVPMRLDEYEKLTRCVNFKHWLDTGDGKVQQKRTEVRLTRTQLDHVATALSTALQHLEKANPSTDAERDSYNKTYDEVRETLQVVLASAGQ